LSLPDRGDASTSKQPGQRSSGLGQLLTHLAQLAQRGVAERAPGARQAGHHRAGRNADDIRELAIRQALELAKNQ
jgi:hypothetical protein